MSKIDHKISKAFKSLKFWGYLVSIGAGIGIALFLFIQVSRWYDAHQVIFQSPIIIKIQSPVIIKERQPEKVIKVKAIKLEGTNENGNITAGLSKGQVAYEAYKTVWYRESGNGTNDNPQGLHIYCRNKGLVNEVGYDPSNKFCFQDRTEQVATITNWFRNCLDKDEIGKCLSVYSSGEYNELGYEEI